MVRARKFYSNCAGLKTKFDRTFVQLRIHKIIQRMSPTAEKPKMIKVSIVEDSRGTRESLTELLGRAAHLRCVGAHANGEEALRKIPEEIPDVVLMDINLPGMNGIECVSRLKEHLMPFMPGKLM